MIRECAAGLCDTADNCASLFTGGGCEIFREIFVGFGDFEDFVWVVGEVGFSFASIRAGRLEIPRVVFQETMDLEGQRRRFRVEPLLGGGALLLLLVGCFFVLRPFMTALMWAIILAYSLHPLQRTFTGWFRGSRTLAACFVTLTMAMVLAGPITLIGFSLAEDGKELAGATRKWFMAAPEQAPQWVAQVPLVGDQLSGYWAGFAADRDKLMAQLDKQVKPLRPKIVEENGNELIVKDAPPLSEVAGGKVDEGESEWASSHIVALLGQFLSWARKWLVAVGLAVGQGVTQVLVSAFLAFFLLRDAPVLSARLGVVVDRLAGGRGQHLIKVAGDTVRGVIYGILGTAIAQALVAGLGFWIAGVPGAILLAVLTFFFAVVPFGPPLIWIPAAAWLFAHSTPGWGIFMCLWGILGISSVDNFLRPYLISQGSKMPFVLIFCGVIGGAFAFGLVGVFLGPTLLAVAFRLVEEWSSTPEGGGWKLLPEETSELRNEPPSTTPSHGGESLGVR
jgi:predicted PurR-regulated permease PerM